MTTLRVRWLCHAMLVAIGAALVTGCGDDGTDAQLSRQEGGPNGPETDPSESDYAARINGPSSAEPGTVLKLTLSNIGRLRDSYGLTVTPAGAGIVGPRHLTIEPGRSAKFRIKVKRTPVTIEVESVGAGPEVDAFTIR